MKVRVDTMIQDPLTARHMNMKPCEGFDIEREKYFFDGPASERVAVLDFDPKTGGLLPGVPFRPPAQGRKLGRYGPERGGSSYDPGFIAVSVFGTVLRTMYMFEEPDTLGRSVQWAFGAPQLLVVPRAGQWANAFYERDSHSLQFFHFPHNSETVYTSLSRDIVSHETTHAVLDGIAPDLYNALTPQSLALHEAIADLAALLISFRSGNLTRAVLDATGGSIEKPTEFSSIAEEFGKALDAGGRAGALRSLLNKRTLDPNDSSIDVDGNPNRVERGEPHALSEVLSGALYAVMVRIHTSLRRKLGEGDPKKEFSRSGKALAVGAARFKRMVFRALDYLPPGEVSFADYGRAILAADQASHPDDPDERDWIREEFLRRHMAAEPGALDVETNFGHKAVDGVDLQTLIDSDWVAYKFANENRHFLHIPSDALFKVLPRLVVTKLYHHRGNVQKEVRECILKVAWDRLEENPHKSAPSRRVTVGTALAVDLETHRVRALLTSDHCGGELHEQQDDRNRVVRQLTDAGLLRIGQQGIGPDGRPLRSIVHADITGGAMRARGVARMLHITRGQ